MNTYILILTLIFKTGYGGMGGIQAIEVDSLNTCNRIGLHYVNDISSKRDVNTNEVIYTCVKK